MHLVGFTIEKYHDARSHERQMSLLIFNIPFTERVSQVKSPQTIILRDAANGPARQSTLDNGQLHK